MHRLRPVTIAIALVISGGCNILGPDEGGEDRTLPGTLNLVTVGLSAAVYDQSIPDSVNVHVIVASVNVCPKNARCQIADGIWVRNVREEGDDGVHIPVDNPRQFVSHRAYTLSLLRSGPYSASWTDFYVLTILGFDSYAR